MSKKNQLKLELNETVKGSKKSEKQKSAINNIKTVYKSLEKGIELYDVYFRNVYQAKHRTKHR